MMNARQEKEVIKKKRWNLVRALERKIVQRLPYSFFISHFYGVDNRFRQVDAVLR